MKTICLIGAFDTKGVEYAFVREQILARGHAVFTVDTGIMGSTDLFPWTYRPTKSHKPVAAVLNNFERGKTVARR